MSGAQHHIVDVVRRRGRSGGSRSRFVHLEVPRRMRLEPTRRKTERRVHPGRDWFFVTEGRVRLSLGDRDIIVEAGEAAEFATMTPRALAATDGPAELIMIFDRDGQRAHVHRHHDRNPTAWPSPRPRRSSIQRHPLRHGRSGDELAQLLKDYELSVTTTRRVAEDVRVDNDFFAGFD